MFDNVGRANDADAARRHVMAMMGTAVLSAMAAGLALGVMAYKAAEILTDVPEADTMVEILVTEITADLSLPPPPPPPPLAAAAPEQPDEAEPTPDEMSEDVTDLEEQVEDDVKDDAVAGAEDGQEGGEEGGDPDGTVGGEDGGVVNGTPGGTVFLHHSEVRTKRTRQPVYPSAAYDLNLGEVTCRVMVSIDDKGVPYDVGIELCPTVFHDSIRTALAEWRWYPARVDGERTKAKFLLAVRYIP